jgi:small subunit ribosomal protein S18
MFKKFERTSASRPAASANFSHRPFTRKKMCRFCADKNLKIDYKDTRLLRNFVTEKGKIMPRRVTGNCAYHQRKIAKAIKASRNIAIMPYISLNV